MSNTTNSHTKTTMEESVIKISLFMLSQITYQDTGGVDMRNMLSTESIICYKIHQVEEKSSSQIM